MKRVMILCLGSAFILVLLLAVNALFIPGATFDRPPPMAPAANNPGRTVVVTSISDSGPGTLRQALLNAQSGDTITFDPSVFRRAVPATIALTSGLPDISQDNLTIDASDAGVILDGSDIGIASEMMLVDDVSLTLDGGPNLIVNGDFSAGLGHWRPWDEAPGVSRTIYSSDFHSSPSSCAWSTIAHAGEARTAYDTTNTSDAFDYRPHHGIYYEGNTVWIPITGGSTAELRFWYRYGPIGAKLHVLFPDGRVDGIGEWRFDRYGDWTEVVVNEVVPDNALGVALELIFHHSEYWTNGFSVSSSGNVVQGLQIIGFPAAGVALFEDAQHNRIGGDPTMGTGPMGQGNLLSGNGNRGIILSGASFNTIAGNYIGTDLSGVVAKGNRWEAIHMNGASHNVVIGNLLSGNRAHGIDLCCNASFNTIRGNYIGTGAHGRTPLGNNGSGIAMHQGSSYNTVGPENVIAHNAGSGVRIGTGRPLYNTITQNRIHGNEEMGIDLYDGGNSELAAPFITVFDLSAGTVIGHTCPNCKVEFFSDGEDEGEIFEGRTTADAVGALFFDKDEPFTGPHLTATATDVDGNTSEFSTPVSDMGRYTNMQEGNTLPIAPLQPGKSNELENNRIGGDVGNWGWDKGHDNADLYNDLQREIFDAGLNWVRTNFWSPNPLNWQEVLRAPGVYEIPVDVDHFITELSTNGINVLLTLSAGAGLDGAEHGWWGGAGWGVLGDREPEWWFNTQENRDEFIAYASFMVQHFKGRVRYYEIWNEPSAGEYPEDGRGGVAVNDYVTLIKQVAPVLRQIDPDAKIVVGAIGPFQERERQWLRTVFDAGAAPFTDAVSWHAFSGDSPLTDSGEYPRHPEPFYWRDYPVIVQSFKDHITAQGFGGEYMVEESVWRTPNDLVPHETPLYTDIEAAKYAARANIIHLSLDFAMVSNQMLMPDVIKLLPRYYVIRNLSTVTAGVEPASLPFSIQTTATNTVSYTFSFPGGSHLIALWTDGVAVDDDPGVPSTLTIPDLAEHTAVGIDVLYGLQQQMVTSEEQGDLVIRDLLIKDYPLILWVYEPKCVFLPTVMRTAPGN